MEAKRRTLQAAKGGYTWLHAAASIATPGIVWIRKWTKDSEELEVTAKKRRDIPQEGFQKHR